MEREMGQFGLADYYAAKNRIRASFLDGVEAMMSWKRILLFMKHCSSWMRRKMEQFWIFANS